jgi:hypothetical protein
MVKPIALAVDHLLVWAKIREIATNLAHIPIEGKTGDIDLRQKIGFVQATMLVKLVSHQQYGLSFRSFHGNPLLRMSIR